MHELAGRGGGSRRLDAAVDEMGRTRQARLHRAAGLRPVRHRAGQHLSRAARRKREGAHQHRLRRLCGGRSRRRRGPAGDVRHARRHPANAAGRPAALSDGGRQAGRHRRRRPARHRHVRLRAADARRPHGAGFYAPRRAQPAQRAPPRRSPADRRAVRLPGLPAAQPRLPASPRPRRGDSRGHAADMAQSAILPGHHARAARRHRDRLARPLDRRIREPNNDWEISRL